MKLPPMNELSPNDFPLEISKVIYYIKVKTQASESLICSSVLNAIAYSCQGNINVEDHSIKPVSIYSIILSESGERKSTVDKMVSQPILDLEKELTQEFESEQIEYESDMELWKLENEHYKKSYLKSKQNNDNDADEWRKKYQENHRLKPKKPKKKIHTR